MKDAVIPSGHFSYCSGTEFFFSFFMVLTSSTASLILSPGLVSNADFAHARFLIKLHGSHIFFFLFPVALFHLGGKWWVVTMPQPETD